MREYTQTNLEPGNCWQTCVACILDVEPEELPPQEKYDLRKYHPDGTWEWLPGKSYNNVLQNYLRTHHNLAYVEMHTPSELLESLLVRPHVFHMMTGRTVRTPVNKSRHVVVGRGGQMIWDPHPSRAGLTDEIKWSFLVPFPKEWGNSPIHQDECVCRSCGGGT